MNDDHVIIGVHVTDRVQQIKDVQAVLTEFGCNIKTRLGLHDVSPSECSPTGLLLIDWIGGEAKCDEMLAKLNNIVGVDTKKMVFSH